MNKTITSSSSLWQEVKDAFLLFWFFYIKSFLKCIFITCLIGLLYIPIQELLFPYLDKLHKFLQDNNLMSWLGGVISLGIIYQFYWLVKYWKADISIYFFGLIFLMGGLYVYYIKFYPGCHFWLIREADPQIAFVDLLIFPWAIAFALQRCVYLLCFKRKVLNAWPPLLWQLGIYGVENDKPITSEAEDWLGFKDQVTPLFDVLQSLELKEELSSLTLGIIAQWGKGKSSFINLLMAKVKEQGDIVVFFNPRSSKNVAQIQEDFFDAFAKVLSKYYIGFGFLLGRYTKHLGLLGQYEWTRPLESLLTLLLPEKDERAINAALYSVGRRVYVVIDDLDRLTGEEMIEVLKLIDRNASFNNVVFVMAYDKEYVNNVLRKHLDHGLDHSFIDKYVTWEVTLPEIDSDVLKEKMKSYLDNHLFGLPQEAKERALEGWGYVDSIIAENLASVRHLKRYVNLTLPRYREVYDKVNPADFFLLSLLQYRHLSIYNNLARHMYIDRDSEDSDPVYVIPRDLRQRLTEEIPETALFLLQKMFLRYPPEYNSEDSRPPYKELKSIRSVTYFPHYFRHIEDKQAEQGS